MKTILIAGGTGFIGRRIQKLLEKSNFKVTILSRSPKASNEFYWNPTKGEIDKKALENVSTIINLCGASIGDKRWTNSRKEELYQSRIEPTKFLFGLVDDLPDLESYISASGITCYGFEDNQKIYSEKDPFGSDYLSQLVESWENAADLFKSRCRVVKMRTAVVLDEKEGPLSKIAKPIQFGIGSALGDGKQIMSWIHIDDLTNAFLFAIQHPIEGAFNIVGGNHSNQDFSKSLANVLNKPFFFPKVPSFILNFILGEMAVIVLKGVNVSNEKLIDSGFEFKYSDLETTFKAIYSKNL
jgi:uncharacterized protein (TIGR01777 family)